MRKHAPSLDDLGLILVFVRVVDGRSFSGAARALGTTTSAISKRVARLEERLGTRLLTRTTRHVMLTEAGSVLYERGQRVLAEIESAEIEVSRHGKEPRGLLRVNVPVVFGERVVAPLIADLCAKHPDLRIDLSLNDRFVDVVREGWDVVVRIGKLGDSSLMARKLGASSGVIVASPAYLAARGEPKTLDELVTHDCIRYSLLAAANEWRFRLPNGRERVVPVSGRLSVDHGGAARAAAVAGVGLAVLPRFIVAADLATGALREVLGTPSLGELPIHAVWPAGRASPKVTAFVEFFATRLRDQKRCAELGMT